MNWGSTDGTLEPLGRRVSIFVLCEDRDGAESSVTNLQANVGILYASVRVSRLNLSSRPQLEVEFLGRVPTSGDFLTNTSQAQED